MWLIESNLCRRCDETFRLAFSFEIRPEGVDWDIYDPQANPAA
jgi:hypothetical protein